MHVIQFRPLHASRETRVEGSIWSPGPTVGTHWVIPLDNGPRRTILVRKEARTQGLGGDRPQIGVARSATPDRTGP